VRFARRVFGFAGIYGLIVIAPMYFLEGQIAVNDPPAITHPEYYYGFVGLGLAWQVMFLVIARDPARYRPCMLPSMLEKFSFGLAAPVLFGLGRLSASMLAAAMVDLILGTLFVIAYRSTRPDAGAESGDST
jgi:hypothetical protein